MRAYRKTSKYVPHDFVLCLTADEAARLLEELDSAVTEQTPTLNEVRRVLGRPFSKYEEEV